MASTLSSNFALFSLLVSLCFTANAGSVPAVYVFGDSLADVGNNNYLDTQLKANFSHHGVDYPGGKATGRFINGKNSADLLEELLGVPSSPPYLSIPNNTNKAQAFLKGVSFASGGAGILDSTNKGQCLSLSKQIHYFSAIKNDSVKELETDKTNEHLKKSIFNILIGGNDMVEYLSSKENKYNTPEQLLDAMINDLGRHLESLYDLGARKFAFVGTGPAGCCPAMRARLQGNCSNDANTISRTFNERVAQLLEQIKSKHSDMKYSFLNTFLAFSKIMENPSSYGFTEVKDPCCGSVGSGCRPTSNLCSDRTKYMFWDWIHPSQRTSELLIDIFFNGSQKYVYPVNVKGLSA